MTNMENQVHYNYIKASDLIFITIGLGIINVFLSPGSLPNSFSIFVVILIFLFMIGNAFFIRQGHKWAKILYIVLFILGLLTIPSIIKIFSQNLIVGVINVVQIILQIWAFILLVRIPKEKKS